MSFHQTDSALGATPVPAADTGHTPANEALDGLENLAGLIADMTSFAMERTQGNVLQVIRERLGPNATEADAQRALNGLSAALSA